MLGRLLQHHVLANLTFALVLLIGWATYSMLPREKSPTINFNWIQITTFLPGASAEDVEKLVTTPIEDALAKVSDIDFISSASRTGLSSVLVRFEDIDERTYDKRLNDLRREVQNAENAELPDNAESPFIFEITSSNAFPSATLVLSGQARDEVLRSHGRRLEKEIERLSGVERVDAMGLLDPELHVFFDPQRLEGLGLNPTALSDSIRALFQDLSAGEVRLGSQEVVLRMVGTDEEPAVLARVPVLTAAGEVPLNSLAEVGRGRADPDKLVSYQDRPAIMLSVFKKSSANTLDLLDRLNAYISQENRSIARDGVELVLVDDQSIPTREALTVMQTNAIFGLILVLLVSWLFLGSRIALFTTLGIPFTLAATFWILEGLDQTLNNSVLLGVVISLGMLVDDAVVVVEGIYDRLRRGVDVFHAAQASLREVFAPVTASVLTTIAAFLPLMLLPGILGKFMMVIPLVVTVALAVSLLEAYWMLPVHIIAARVSFDRPSRAHHYRERFNHWLRIRYGRLLLKVMRRPRLSIALVIALVLVVVVGGARFVNVNFFAMESFRLFYVNVEMPAGTPLEQTLDRLKEVERRVRAGVEEGEVRAIVSYSGIMFTETEPLIGDQYGQVMVSLEPRRGDMREVGEVVAAIRPAVASVPGPKNIVFFEKKDGPPTTKPINIKVRGDDFDAIHSAVSEIKAYLGTMPAVSDVTDNDASGQLELKLRPDYDAIRRAGLDPQVLTRTLRLLGDGEIVSAVQSEGEKVEVRVRAAPERMQSVDDVLRLTLALPDGGAVRIGELVGAEVTRGRSNIRHYNLQRTISVEAELDKAQMDTVTANNRVKRYWADELSARHPGISLDFSGELDDINDSLNSIAILFLFGLGLIYLILGTQFESYFQPLMIISTVPMAFTGVILGLLITNNPLSLYTLYGVVALAGIAVNSAIVLISAANDRRAQGMSVLHAVVYAARRRLVPILITALTTVAGLFSLATGLGGHSLIWGPVATAIVWGLAFSTVLTLFVIPLLYRFFMGGVTLRLPWRRGRAAGR